MNKRSIIEAMKADLIETLEGLPVELLGVNTGTDVKKETGENTAFVKCEVEIPKGHGKLSRCRFTCKILGGQVKVSEEQLAETEYVVTFQNLMVSYIDSNGTVYFRADDYTIQKEGK